MARSTARMATVAIVAACVIFSMTTPAGAGPDDSGPGLAGSTRAAPASPTGQNSTATAASGEPVHLMNLVGGSNNQCLIADITYSHLPLYQFSCDYLYGQTWNDQYWIFEWRDHEDGVDYYRIKNLAYSLASQGANGCMVVYGGANGARAYIYLCLAYPDQQWAIVTHPTATGVFMLRNRNSGKCLVVQGTSKWSEAFQYDCHPEFRDQWWT